MMRNKKISGIKTPAQDELPETMDAFPKQILSAQDIMGASRVEAQAFGDKAETPQTLYVISRAGELLSIKSRGIVVASKAVIYGADRAMSASTSVYEQNRGKGYGTRLASLMEDNARAHGMKEIFALVNPQNGPQLSSYLNKSGWQITGYLPNLYGREGDYGFGGDKLIVSKRFAEYAESRQDSIVDATDTKALKREIESGKIGVRVIRGEKDFKIAFAHDPIEKTTRKPRVFKTNDEVVRALAIEAKHIQSPSSPFFLRSMEMTGFMAVQRGEDGLSGFVAALCGTEKDAYVHGPFTDDLDPKNLLLKAEKQAENWGAHSTWSVAPVYDKTRIAFLKSSGYEVTDKAQGLCDGKDLLRLSKRLEDA